MWLEDAHSCPAHATFGYMSCIVRTSSSIELRLHKCSDSSCAPDWRRSSDGMWPDAVVPAQVQEVMLLEEEKENSRREQRGSQPQRTARQILKMRNDPPPRREAAWQLVRQRRANGRERQQTDWLPARARQQQGGHRTPASGPRYHSAAPIRSLCNHCNGPPRCERAASAGLHKQQELACSCHNWQQQLRLPKCGQCSLHHEISGNSHGRVSVATSPGALVC